MECLLLPKDNHHHSDSNVVSKPMESAIQIDSISIDLINANENGITAEKCEHFSIRGFVSQIRQKEWKICSPFASDGENDKHREQACPLPPLDVPKFRFWHCRNCLQEIGVNVTPKDIGPILKFCNTALKSNNICSHGPTLFFNFQQIPKAGSLGETNIDASPSADLNETSEKHLSSGIDKKGSKNEAGNGTIRGCVLVSKENSDHEVHRPTSVASDVSPKLMQKTCHKNDKDVKLNCNGSTDECQPAARYQETTGFDSAGNLNNLVKHSGQTKETGKGTSTCFHNVVTPPEGTNSVKEIHDADNLHRAGHLSQELDEHDFASSESAEIPVGNKHHDLHHDNSGGTHRKKVRKVRLLTELLSENGEDDTNNTKTEDSASNANPDESAVVDKLPPSQSQLVIQGNARRCLGHSKKRKLSQDDDWRPPEMASPNKVSSVVKNSKRDSESADAIVVSESEDDLFARVGSYNGAKNNWTRRRIDKGPVGKNKDKRVLMFDDCLSLDPSQESMPSGAGNTTVNSPKGKAVDVFLKSGVTESTGREIDLFPLPVPRMERKLSFGNKKSKIPMVHDLQPSVIPWNHGMLGEGIITGKDVDTMHTGPVIIPFRSVEDPSGDKGLNLSLNSYIATQNNEAQYFREVEGRNSSLLNQQEGFTSAEDQIKRNASEARYDGNFSFYPKSVVDTPFAKFVQSDISCKRPTMPFLDERQNFTSHVEIEGSLFPQKDFYSTSRNFRNVRKQEHPTVKRRDTDQRVDKMPEQGTADDIPMEIVELMAKNQYERCLADAETSKNTSSAQTMDFSQAYRHRELNFFQQETFQKWKGVSKNESEIIKRTENFGSIKQKSVDHFCQADRSHFRLGQLEKPHITAGFGSFIHRQETSPGGVQHPASSSSRQNVGENIKWIGDLTGKRFCPISSQASGPRNTCQNIPQQSKESSHLWSNIVSNHVPFLYSFPQKRALSTDMDMLPHFSVGLHKEKMNGDHDLKFLNQNVSCLGKQNRNFGSETHSRVGAEFPFACKHNGIELNQKSVGSLDLYSNETIPAMHLLSLMDAGLRSNAPANLDTNPKFAKRPAPLDQKDIPRLDTVACRATNSMKHPMYDFCAENQATEKPCEQISAIRNLSAVPNASTSVSPFQLDKHLKKTIDFSVQVSQEKEKTRDFDSQTQSKGNRSKKRASSSGNFGTNCGSFPVHSMQTMLFGPPDSMLFPLQFRPLENSVKHRLEASNATGTANPYKSSSKTEICSLNSNPSDFSIPEAGNVFMIAGEDLRFGNMAPSANEPGLVRSSGHKKQRKSPAAKAHGRQLI